MEPSNRSAYPNVGYERSKVSMNATGMSRVTVAIVLMDIVGSMRLIAEIGDLEFLKLFQKYSERVGYAAQQHNGIIVKTMGDAGGLSRCPRLFHI